jgi:hypothetical protein
MPRSPVNAALPAAVDGVLRGLAIMALALFGGLVLSARASAAPLGSPAVLSAVDVQSGPYSPGNPSAAYDSDLDRFLVVWASEHESAGTSAIWGRFVTPDGAPSGTAFKVANAKGAADGLDAINARVAYSAPLHRYLVVFNGQVPDSDTEILAQSLDAQGGKVGGVVAVSANTWGGTDQPQVVANDARSGFSVFYFASRDDVQVRSLFGNLVTASGVGPMKRLSPDNGVKYLIPTAAVNESNGEIALAMLIETDSQVTETGTGEVGVLRVSADLNAVGGVTRPLPVGQNLSYKPSIAWDATRNEYAVAWPRRTGTDAEIWAVRYSAALSELGTPQQISSTGPAGNTSLGTGIDSAIVASPTSDQYAAFWVGDASTDDQFEAYGRSLGGDLAPLADQVPLSTMAPGTTSPREVLTGALAYDEKRDRWLVPWAGKGANTGWQILGRLFEPVRPAPAAAGPAPVASAAPCPGQQLYVTRKGNQCAAVPAAKFSVGATAQGGRLLRCS